MDREIPGALQEAPAGCLQGRVPAMARQYPGFLGAHMIQGLLILATISTG
jgi:hypothetical protein